MKKAVQMYAIRMLAKEDMEKALRIVSEIGYEGVEFAGFFGHSAQEIAGWLKKYNLEAMGAHIPLEDVFEKTEETIAFHKAIGNNRIIIPWSEIKTKEDTLALAKKMCEVAPKLHEAGMKLYYHNHNHEFKKDGNEYLIDILAQNTPADVLSLEFDIYWVYRGGEDPLAYLKKYQDRIEIFHVKDGIEDKGTQLSFGAVDLPAIIAFAKEQQLAWAVVESEASEDMAEQVDAICKDFTVLKEIMD